MKRCPYCGYSNYDTATECRKCEASFATKISNVQKTTFWFGPEKARAFRSKALALFILGLMIRVYWGGVGPWPVIDSPTLVSLRSWVEPLFIYGGIVLYLGGWVLRWI